MMNFIKKEDGTLCQNKALAFLGALVGAVVLIILALKEASGLEILFPAYLHATLGQLPSKGLHDLGRLKVEAETLKRGRS